MTGSNDNGNGKITLAVLGNKVDMIVGEIQGLRGDIKGLVQVAHENRTNIAVLGARGAALEKCQVDLERSVSEQIDGLTARVNTWSSFNSVGGLIAVIMAAFGLTKS